MTCFLRLLTFFSCVIENSLFGKNLDSDYVAWEHVRSHHYLY